MGLVIFFLMLDAPAMFFLRFFGGWDKIPWKYWGWFGEINDEPLPHVTIKLAKTVPGRWHFVHHIIQHPLVTSILPHLLRRQSDSACHPVLARQRGA